MRSAFVVSKETPMPITNEPDEQDQSETFDETHLDDEGDATFLLDEADPVLDVTQADGDSDEDEFDDDEEVADLTDVLSMDGVEDRPVAEDQLVEEGPVARPVASGADEVELVYSGLMENVQGAQASAAHWESKNLSDDDIDALGYGADADDAEGDKA